MTVRELSTESDLVPVLEKAETLLIDFWSPLCPPCKAFAPVFEAAAARHPSVAFCKVNTREKEELSAAFDVEHIPTLVAIRERVMVASQPGYLSGDQIDELLRQVRELDMEALQEHQTGSGEAEEVDP